MSIPGQDNRWALISVQAGKRQWLYERGREKQWGTIKENKWSSNTMAITMATQLIRTTTLDSWCSRNITFLVSYSLFS